MMKDNNIALLIFQSKSRMRALGALADDGGDPMSEMMMIVMMTSMIVPATKMMTDHDDGGVDADCDYDDSNDDLIGDDTIIRDKS